MPAERQRSKDPKEHVGRRDLLTTTLGSLVDMFSAKDEPKYYLSEWMVFEKIPSLAGDLGSLAHYQRMRRSYPESLQRRMQLKPTLWLGPAGAYIVSLSRDRRMALKHEVRRSLGVGDEPFELTARAWVVTGRVGPVAS